MAKNLEVEVANLVCRFGSTLVLNDLLREVVLPGFLSDDIRKIQGTEYFLIDQKFVYLEDRKIESLALCCRLVKNTTLRRHQIYSPSSGIIADEKSLASAPTSIAVLLLKSHRLLFVKEVPGAPSMQQFGATLKHRLRNSVLQYHSALVEEEIKGRGKLAKKHKSEIKKEIAEKFPIPDVSVTAITSKEALKTFIHRFGLLTTLRVEIAPTNNELDNEEFFQNAREAQDQVKSIKSTLTHHNSKGLNKEGVLEHVEAAKQGNLRVRMVGKDKNGDDLKGDNEDFSVKASLGVSEIAFDQGIEAAYSRYQDLKSSRVISEGQHQSDYADKLREAFNLQ